MEPWNKSLAIGQVSFFLGGGEKRESWKKNIRLLRQSETQDDKQSEQKTHLRWINNRGVNNKKSEGWLFLENFRRFWKPQNMYEDTASGYWGPNGLSKNQACEMDRGKHSLNLSRQRRPPRSPQGKKHLTHHDPLIIPLTRPELLRFRGGSWLPRFCPKDSHQGNSYCSKLDLWTWTIMFSAGMVGTPAPPKKKPKHEDCWKIPGNFQNWDTYLQGSGLFFFPVVSLVFGSVMFMHGS